MSSKDIKRWEKTGIPKFLVNKFGKSTISQLFINPKTGEEEEFVLFQEKDFTMVFAITADQQVITVRQYRPGCDDIVRELPAGGVEEGEIPSDSIKRELAEETGYTSNDIRRLGPVLYSSTSNATTKCHPFLALNCQKTKEQILDQKEDVLVELIPLSGWLKKCREEVVEPNSVAITFRALSYLK